MPTLSNADGVYPGATNILSTTSFAISVDIFVVSDRGAVAQSLITCTDSFGTDADAYLSWDNNTESMYMGSYNPTDGENQTVFSARPRPQRWFNAILTCAGTGSGQLMGGWSYDGRTFYTGTSTLKGNSTGTVDLRLGNDGFSNWSNVMYANFKLWAVPLSIPELVAEARNYQPQRLANLTSWVPMNPRTSVALALTDMSGHGNNLTATGALAIVDGVPNPIKAVPMYRQVLRVPSVAVVTTRRLAALGVG